MKRNPKNPVGWNDWVVALAMIFFVVLMLCSLYTGEKFLKYIAIIPGFFAIVRTFHNT